MDKLPKFQKIKGKQLNEALAEDDLKLLKFVNVVYENGEKIYYEDHMIFEIGEKIYGPIIFNGPDDYIRSGLFVFYENNYYKYIGYDEKIIVEVEVDDDADVYVNYGGLEANIITLKNPQKMEKYRMREKYTQDILENCCHYEKCIKNLGDIKLSGDIIDKIIIARCTQLYDYKNCTRPLTFHMSDEGINFYTLVNENVIDYINKYKLIHNRLITGPCSQGKLAELKELSEEFIQEPNFLNAIKHLSKNEYKMIYNDGGYIDNNKMIKILKYDLVNKKDIYASLECFRKANKDLNNNILPRFDTSHLCASLIPSSILSGFFESSFTLRAPINSIGFFSAFMINEKVSSVDESMATISAAIVSSVGGPGLFFRNLGAFGFYNYFRKNFSPTFKKLNGQNEIPVPSISIPFTLGYISGITGKLFENISSSWFKFPGASQKVFAPRQLAFSGMMYGLTFTGCEWLVNV